MIGDTLRTERERQQLTIHDIEEGTSIRALYIEAIENGEYDKLPGKVYAKGFVKNYANFLGLDGEELAKNFSDEITPIEAVGKEEVPAYSKNEQKEKRIVREEEFLKNTSTDAEPQGTSRGSMSGKILVAAVVLIAAAAGLYFGLPRSVEEGKQVATVEVTQENNVVPDQTPSPQQIETVTPKEPVTQPETVTPAPVVAPAPAAAPVAAAAPANNAVNVHAKFSDDCWVQVVADGAVIYEGTAGAGQVLDWTGNNNVNVWVGNAGAIDITMNGQNLGKLGNDGDIVERNFTK